METHWTVNGTIIQDSTGYTVAQVWPDTRISSRDSVEKMQARALLIAAAPGLLIACERMLGAMGCDELNGGRVFDDELRKQVKDFAKAALAKAKP